MYRSYTYANAATMLIVATVLGIVGAILIYFLFLTKKNEGKFTGFVGWLYDFLSFKKMFLETLLKITYLALAIWITVYSFTFIGMNFLLFLGVLVLGNILLVICRNTTEIANNLKKKDVKKESK